MKKTLFKNLFLKKEIMQYVKSDSNYLEITQQIETTKEKSTIALLTLKRKEIENILILEIIKNIQNLPFDIDKIEDKFYGYLEKQFEACEINLQKREQRL